MQVYDVLYNGQLQFWLMRGNVDVDVECLRQARTRGRLFES